MFRRYSNSRGKIIFLAAALAAFPGAMLAQRGGGGRIGGPAAGGAGLNNGNHATGVDAKDDLSDFHQIMAVQASPEQKLAFAAMLKSTAAASAQVQEFVDQLNKENSPQEIASRDKDLGDAVEMARTLNKRFLEGFSEAQKSGLKEMIKRLGKADSEVGQQARALDQAFESKIASSQMANVASGLEHTLEVFQHEQLGLGEEMSIEGASGSQEANYALPAVKNTANIGNQAISIVTSGLVSKAAVEGGQNTFSVKLTADITDLQHSMTEVMRNQLNQANRCGERIEIATAELTPEQPAGLMTAQLHYERWTCNPMLGRDDMNEMVEGNGTIAVKLTPGVGPDGTLRLTAEMERVEAEGLLGQLLRSDSLGEKLRDKIAASILAALDQGGDFKAALPPGTRDFASLKRAHFQDMGAGRLMVVMDGEIRVSNEQVAALTTALKQQSATAERSVLQPELMTR
ncbi:MAG: hypothetical protein ABSF97_08865 [Candidatus Sulfotelmatobacter sp.]|jgi:hypothetical protein